MKQEGRGSLSLSWQQAEAQKGGCGTDARSQACAIRVVFISGVHVCQRRKHQLRLHNLTRFSVPCGPTAPSLSGATAYPQETSWGSTTRAKQCFAGAALLTWQLWGRHTGRPASGWTLLRNHEDDRTLAAAWASGLWAIHTGSQLETAHEFDVFRLVMTGLGF